MTSSTPRDEVLRAEAVRLGALRSFRILDTPREQAFDDLATLAAMVCRTPMAGVSLVDETRQWFKAAAGVSAVEMPRELSFCTHAILSREPFIVPDASLDPRFAGNPLVSGESGLRFYAAVPLTTPDGHALGTICVADYVPRELTAEQIASLEAIARQVMAQLELRRVVTEQQRNELWFRSLASSSPVGIYRTDTAGMCEYTNPRWQEIAGLSFAQSLGRGWTNAIHPDDRDGVLAAWDESVRRNEEFAMEFRFAPRDGASLYVHSRAALVRGADGEPAGWVGTVADVTAHRRAEEALRTSEERLQRVLEGSNDGFWDWNVVTGAVQFSQRLAEMLGYTLAEMPPHVTTWEQLIHPDDLADVMRQVRAHLDGKSEHYETEHRLRCRSGQWKWILDRGKVVARAGDGTPLRMAGTHSDIDERRKAERGLERFFSLTLDLLAIASTDGWFRRLNPAFETVLGYTTAELLSRPFIEFVHPDDREATMAEAERLRAGHPTVHFENRYLCRDGSTKWLAWSASPAPDEDLIYAAGRDITASKAAEQALRESDMRTRAIIDNSLGAVITSDVEGRLETINPTGERMFGYRADQLVGRSVAMLYAGKTDLADVVKSSLGRVTRWTGRRSNGETFPCDLSLFEFQTGTARHYAAHIVDASDREEAEKMKRDFVATVSHELRTPLTAIRGSLGLLASGALGALPPEAQALVIVAERNSVRLISLINDILDFEKLDSGSIELELQPVPIARMIERSIEIIGVTAAQEHVAISWDACAGNVLGDEMRLQQVTLNLLSNAIKFSPRGARVSVEAARSGDWIEVRVTDHGPGIEEDGQKKLFHRFHQVDASDSRSKRGTGLGLAICKAIVQQHGGTIGVDSRPGEGSTFWFRVPAIAEAS